MSNQMPARDEFDAILEEQPAPPGTAPDHDAHETYHEIAAPHTMPGWSDFEAGWPIYKDPILCGSAAGLVLGVLGVFIVLRRAVFVTAAVSQAAGLGVALAFYSAIHLGFALSPALGALLFSLLCTAILALPSERRIARDTVIGISYVTTSALALLVGDRISQEAHDVSAILFGSAVVVRPVDLGLVLGVGLLALLALGMTGRGLVFAGFDPDGARVQGVPVRALEVGFWLVVATMVAVSTRALGSLPVFAFAVLPASGALALARSVRSAALLAGVCGTLAGSLGYLVAFFGELPVGASQTGVAAVLTLVLVVAGRLRSRFGR
jgi:zinc transport system permease protein